MELVVMILAGFVGAALLGLVASWLFSRSVAAKVEKHMPPQGKMTTVEGGQIHWVDSGDGPPIVMIHGLSGNHHNFTHSATSKLSDSFRTIAIDRPGCGHARRDSNEGARLPEQARMIAEFLDREEIEKPLIVGHSLGGAVALALALDFPDKIAGLALIAPLIGAQSSVPPVFSGIDIANPGVRRFVAETLAVPTSIQQGARVVAAIFAPDKPPEDFRTRGGGLLSLRPQAFHASSTDLHAVPLDLPAQIERYAELKLPVGILYGDADPVLAPDFHIDCLRSVRPDCEIKRIDGAGHMLPVTHPEQVADLIRSVVARSSILA
jgi:pimeloyl-ACP methyl ester carboxylesterase